MPLLKHALALYYVLVPAEVSSNMARFDGVRYGEQADGKDLLETYMNTRGQLLGSEVKRRIMLGTYVLSSGYYDAYYKQAQTVRTKLIAEFKTAFESVDFLVGPTAPTTAFKIGENISDPMKMYLTDIMTVAVNLVGVPAISIPAGTSDGLPVGLQIIGQQKKDKHLLEFAKQAEGAIK